MFLIVIQILANFFQDERTTTPPVISIIYYSLFDDQVGKERDDLGGLYFFFTYLILSNLQIPSLDSRKPLAGSSMRLIAPLMFAAERRMMKVKLSLDMRVMYSERWSVVVVGAEAEAIFVRGELGLV